MQSSQQPNRGLTNDAQRAMEAAVRQGPQRHTPGRRRLLEVLSGASRPLTIAELLSAGGGLVQSSAYRNLAVLEGLGVIRRVAGVDEYVRFELAEWLTGHHHHLACTSCGLVVDAELDPGLERQLLQALGAAAQARGFQLNSHRVDGVGSCSRCATPPGAGGAAG